MDENDQQECLKLIKNNDKEYRFYVRLAQREKFIEKIEKLMTIFQPEEKLFHIKISSSYFVKHFSIKNEIELKEILRKNFRVIEEQNFTFWVNSKLI